jgi:thiol peroxidase
MDMNVELNGQATPLYAQPLEVGAELPHFKLETADGEVIKTRDLLGKKTLISVVPDINTSVCSLQTRRFNQEADNYPDWQFITVSTNTPAQQADWCAVEGVENITLLSDEQESFGYATGLYVPAAAFDARAIYIVDENGIVTYRQIVDVIGEEPDYDAALAELKK